MAFATSINVPPTAFVDKSGRLTREAYRFLLSLTQNANTGASGEVATPPSGGLQGGGVVADGISLSIQNNGVTSAMLRQSLALSVMGRAFGSNGNVADITADADNRVLGRFGGQLMFRDISLIPGTVADGDYGDITVSGLGLVWTIDAGVVSNAKLASMVQATVKGRAAGAGSGAPVDLTAGQVWAILATTTQAVTTSGLTQATNRILGRTTASTGAIEEISVSSPLTFTAGALGVNATLAAFGSYNTNGILTQTAANTFTGRTITGTANEITVTNGSGIGGDPTLSLPVSMTFTGKTVTGGTFAGVTHSGTTTFPGSTSIDSNGFIICGATNGWAMGALAGVARIDFNGTAFRHLNSGGGNAALTAGAATLASADIQGLCQCDSLRIDQTPTAGAVVPTHTLSINANGTVYRFPCLV